MDQRTSEQPLAGKAPARTLNPGLKLALEMGPLILFFIANFKPKLFEPLTRLFLPVKMLEGKQAGLLTSTSVLMIAVLVALIVSYAMTRRLPLMPVITAVMVLIFGGLTLYFQDQTFIQVKVTILYVLFGLALIVGLLFNRSLLSVVLDNAMALTETGWRQLTLRWGVFFLTLAFLNEIVRRTMTYDHWVYFKFPGTMIIIFLFTFTQVPLIMRHELKGDGADKAPEHI